MATWVLLRGLGREAAHWHELPERLAARTGDRVLTPDLPGVGGAPGRIAPWSIEAMARDVAGRVAGDLGDDAASGIHLVGHSLGGMVAMRWAAAGIAPRVTRLVVVASSLGRLSPPWRRMRLGRLAGIGRIAVSRSPRRRESIVLDMTSTLTGARRAAVLDERTVVASDRPVRPSVVLRQLVAATRDRGPRQIDVPMTVLVGAADRFVDPECSTRIAGAFDASLHVHPTAGHDVPLDDPEWLLDRLAGSEISARRAGVRTE